MNFLKFFHKRSCSGLPSVKANLLANYFGAAAVAVLSFIFAPIYIHLLGAEAYGLIGFFTGIVALSRILDLGLSSTLNRELAKRSAARADPDETRDLVKSVERIYVSIGVLVGLAFVLIAPLAARYWFEAKTLSSDTITYSLMIMGFAFGLRWCSSLYTAGLSGLQRQIPINVINVVSAAVQYAGAILVLKVFGSTIMVFFVYQGIAGLLQTLVLRSFMISALPRITRRPVWNPELLTELKKFALGLTAISVTAILLTQIDRIVLSGVMPLEVFGYYVFAANAASALGRIVSPMFNAFFPRITALVAAGERKALENFYHKASQLMALMVVPLTTILVVFAEPLLLLWTKRPEMVSNVLVPFRLLLVGHALNAFMNIPYALQLAHGWTSLAFKINVVWLMVLTPSLWFGYKAFGVIAAVLVWPILNFLYVVMTIPIMHAKIDHYLMKPWYLRSVLLPTVLSAAPAMIVFFLLGSNVRTAFLAGFLSFSAVLLGSPRLRCEVRKIVFRRSDSAWPV